MPSSLLARKRWIALYSASVAVTAPVRAAEAQAGAGAPEVSSDARRQAAELYDRAVALYEHARYAEAARAFFEADGLRQSSDALSSAIAAARLAHDDLLVARAAERAVARENADPKLASDARAALSEAEIHLARLELTCQPAPCALEIDGEAATAGKAYLLPGTHLLSANFSASSGRVEQRASFAAGSLYTITLAPQSDVHETSTPVAPPAAPTPTTVPPSRHGHADVPRSTKPLQPWVFYAGAGGSLLLGGVTAWSGVSALSQVAHYKQTLDRGDRSTALSSVHRTDWFLAGALALTGITAYVGLRWVDFGGQERTLALAPQARGASLVWSGKL